MTPEFKGLPPTLKYILNSTIVEIIAWLKAQDYLDDRKWQSDLF